MYDFNVLQEVKEAIYYYNEDQLRSEILDYLFAINSEPGVRKKCEYTENMVNITEDYLKGFESIFLGGVNTVEQHQTYRQGIQAEYVSKALAQEIRVEGKTIVNTGLFRRLFENTPKFLKKTHWHPIQIMKTSDGR